MSRRRSLYLAGALAVAAAPAAALAAAPGAAVSPGFTLGATSHPHALGSLANPAGAAARRGQRHVGLGSVSAGAELGPVDGFIDRLDDALAADLDDEDEFLEFIDFFEAAVEDGYLKLGGEVQLPLTPVVVPLSGERGDALTVEARGSGQARLGLLFDDGGFSPNNGNADDAEVAFQIQDATIQELRLGYARPLVVREEGRLVGGARLNMIQGELSQAVIPFDEVEDDDTADVLDDALRDDTEASTRVGVDLGALWVAERWQAGATLRNVNEPSLDYRRIGTDCDDYDTDSTARARCNAAERFIDSGELDASPEYTLERQLGLEGAVYTPDRTWVVAGSLDANGVEDAFGDDHQWATLSVSAAPPQGWLPGVRFGYRKNLTGSELEYITTGLTLFSVVDLDLAYARDSVEHEDESYPRSLMFSIGAGVTF